jgi:hypothetical protein
MAQKDLELFLEERVEFEKLFDRRDDADRIGFQLARQILERWIFVIRNLRLEEFSLERLFDDRPFFHVEHDLRAPLLHRDDAQNASHHADRVQIGKSEFVNIGIFFVREKEAEALVVGLRRHLEHFVVIARLNDNGRRHAREKRTAVEREDVQLLWVGQRRNSFFPFG